MDPQNQQSTPPQQSGGSFNPQQYGFITDPKKPKKQSLLTGKSQLQRIILVVAGGLALLMIVVIGWALLFGGDDGKSTLIAVTKQQSELISLSQNGIDTATTTDTKTLAATTRASISTDKQRLVASIGKVSDKETSGSIDSATETKLANAVQNGQYDIVFESTLREMLLAYQSSLRSANEATASQKTQEVLALEFENASTLLSFVE